MKNSTVGVDGSRQIIQVHMQRRKPRAVADSPIPVYSPATTTGFDVGEKYRYIVAAETGPPSTTANAKW